MFDSEIHKLKALALSTMLGAVRDVITSSAPPQIAPQLGEIIDTATVKLGGEPIRGPVLSMFRPQHEGNGLRESRTMG
jgi:hypothetical protein